MVDALWIVAEMVSMAVGLLIWPNPFEQFVEATILQAWCEGASWHVAFVKLPVRRS